MRIKSEEGIVVGEVRAMTRRRGFILEMPGVQWRAGMPTRRGGLAVKWFYRRRDAVAQCLYIHHHPETIT